MCCGHYRRIKTLSHRPTDRHAVAQGDTTLQQSLDASVGQSGRDDPSTPIRRGRGQGHLFGTAGGTTGSLAHINPLIHCLPYQRSYSTLSPVSTGMGDRLRADIPPRFVTKPTRSTQPCIPSWSLNRVPNYQLQLHLYFI